MYVEHVLQDVRMYWRYCNWNVSTSVIYVSIIMIISFDNNYQSNTLHYWVEVNAHLYTLVNANCHNEQNNYFTAGKGKGI